MGPFINKAFTRKFVSRNINHLWRGDNTKSVQTLGMTYRPLEAALTEHVQQLIDGGVIAPRG